MRWTAKQNAVKFVDAIDDLIHLVVDYAMMILSTLLAICAATHALRTNMHNLHLNAFFFQFFAYNVHRSVSDTFCVGTPI